jgi:hypothetical protein
MRDNDEAARDRAIDPLRLDVECLRQAEVFYKWSEQAVLARCATEEAKTRLGDLQSKLELAIRKDPERHGIFKVTDASVAARVAGDPSVRKATERLHKLRKAERLLAATVDSLEMKKRMLEHLVTLHGQQYFAGPATPHDLGALWVQRQKTDAQLNKRQVARARQREPKPTRPKLHIRRKGGK